MLDHDAESVDHKIEHMHMIGYLLSTILYINHIIWYVLNFMDQFL